MTPRVRAAGAAAAIASLLGAAFVACARDGDRAGDRLGLVQQRSVFGDDDRLDYYAQPNTELQRITRESIVASIPPTKLDFTNPASIGVSPTPTFEQAANLCPDQRFLDQPTVAECSATLIDDDLIVSAGHCFADLAACRARVFAFNYYATGPSTLATIDRSDVFGCRSLVVRQDSFDDVRGRLDYAVIQLDRPAAAPHAPAPIAPGFGAMSEGDHVANIGFGEGLPAKLDDGASLLHPPDIDGFVATIDSFPGNSGGGVFRADHQLVGVLVTSTGVFVTRDAGCKAVHVLPESGTPTGAASEARFVRNAVLDLCASGWPSARLCGAAAACGDGKCTGVETSVTCASDCDPPRCGDGVCSPNEEFTCLPDCVLGCSATGCAAGSACGDAGVCEPQNPDAGRDADADGDASANVNADASPPDDGASSEAPEPEGAPGPEAFDAEAGTNATERAGDDGCGLAPRSPSAPSASAWAFLLAAVAAVTARRRARVRRL
jgi:hypothetical protein